MANNAGDGRGDGSIGEVQLGLFKCSLGSLNACFGPQVSFNRVVVILLAVNLPFEKLVLPLLIELGLLLCCGRLGEVCLFLRYCRFERPWINA